LHRRPLEKPMRWREFITFIGAALAAYPFTVDAQQSEPARRIAVLIGVAAALILLLGLNTSALAQTYPDKPIKIIVPAAAGGPARGAGAARLTDPAAAAWQADRNREPARRRRGDRSQGGRARGCRRLYATSG